MRSGAARLANACLAAHNYVLPRWSLEQENLKGLEEKQSQAGLVLPLQNL